MGDRACYERFLKKSGLMNHGKAYCELTFTSRSDREWDDCARIVEVHDTFVVVEVYIDGVKKPRTTVPFQQLVIVEI